MRCIILIILSVIYFPSILQAQVSLELPLIPKPNKITYLEGNLDLNRTMPFYISEEFGEMKYLLQELPLIQVDKVEEVRKLRRSQNNGLRLLKAEETDRIAADAYKLTINDSGIILKAHNVEALIDGILTLSQITYFTGENKVLHALEIEDSPRFVYRGLQLDISKHFLPLQFIHKMVDVMAFYKFNHLHLHLTDAAGWRLEINKYPALTEIAAWRTHLNWKDWWENGRVYMEKGEPSASGGFYTQDQMRNLVAYAARKGITIVPEIQFPSQSEEVLAIYPDLACTDKAYTQGEFCIGNPKGIEFIKNVLDEVLDIFPSPYIHIGGTKTDKPHWDKCPKCQELMQKEGLENWGQLQDYAIHQVDEYLTSKGRKMVGWEDIVLVEGLSKGVTVMSLKEIEGGVKAANAGHDVIMTPVEYLFFDRYQADPRSEPEAVGGYLPLDKVYSYNPIPAMLEESKHKQILGAQANLWTEYMPNYQQVEYMAFPRSLALAEINWTKQELRNWKDFERRLQAHYRMLQDFEINYRRPSYNVRAEVKYNDNKKINLVTLHSEQKDADIRYTTDGRVPEAKDTPYSMPLELGIPTILKAAFFKDSIRIGSIEEVQLDIHKAIGKPVTYNNPYSEYPAQEDKTLTNGVKGGLSYKDGEWQSFTEDIDIVVDLERREQIESVSMQFMQLPGSGIYYPGSFKVFLSDNGKTFKEVGEISYDFKYMKSTLSFSNYKITLDKPQVGRYVKVVATNPMGGYLFSDELVVY